MSQEQRGNQPELPSRPSCPSPGSPSPFPGHKNSKIEPPPSAIANEHNPSFEKPSSSASKHHIHQFPQSEAHKPTSAYPLLKELGDPTLSSDPSDTEAACRSTLCHLARSYGMELSIPTIAVASEPLQSVPWTFFDPVLRRDFDIAGAKSKSPADQ